jgi:hypothetical protein
MPCIANTVHCILQGNALSLTTPHVVARDRRPATTTDTQSTHCPCMAIQHVCHDPFRFCRCTDDSRCELRLPCVSFAASLLAKDSPELPHHVTCSHSSVYHCTPLTHSLTHSLTASRRLSPAVIDSAASRAPTSTPLPVRYTLYLSESPTARVKTLAVGIFCRQLVLRLSQVLQLPYSNICISNISWRLLKSRDHSALR